MDFAQASCTEFVTVLASNAPVPGGGGASALVGALGAALASMVGNYTLGKQKYAGVEAEVRALMVRTEELRTRLLAQVDADAAACGEILYGIIRELTAVTPDIAMLLYVAIATDTGCFVYSNTTAQTHRIASELLGCGIDVGPVNKALFRTKSRTRLAMEARMVADMTLFDQDRVVVMTIPLSLRQEMHATEADIEELSSLAALVEGTDCGVTLRELRPGVIKISLRTGPRVDACAVCQKLGGGGHKAAAGATADGTMDEVRSAVLRAYQEVVG